MADTTVAYKCPNCAAPLSFKPGAENVTCEYCGAEFTVDTVEKMFQKEQERAAKAAQAEKAKWDTAGAGSEWDAAETEALKSFTCSACGATLVCDENTMATECCYCGNPTMVPSRFDGMMKPDYVIPFVKTKKDAVAALKKFYEGKMLLPAAFTANFRAESVNVYDTEDETITETSVYDCEREGTMRFSRIPVDGSEKMDDTYMESIEPFDYSALVPFSASYLTGYLADKYDVDAEAAVPRADERVETSAVGVLQDTVTGYDNVAVKEQFIAKEGGKVAYAMAPVWILTTKYAGKAYTFMLNGQTGKMVGSLPYDKNKSLLYPLVPAVIVLPIVYFIAKMFLA